MDVSQGYGTISEKNNNETAKNLLYLVIFGRMGADLVDK